MAFFFFPSKMFTFGFICSKLQLKIQDEFAIFQQLKFHKHVSPYLKMTVLLNQYQCKTAFAACNFCQNTSFRQIKTKPIVFPFEVFPFIFMCDYVHILIPKGIVSSDQLIGVRYHLVVAFCIIILTVLQGVMINVSKTGTTKSFSKTQFTVHRTE